MRSWSTGTPHVINAVANRHLQGWTRGTGYDGQGDEWAVPAKAKSRPKGLTSPISSPGRAIA